VISAGYPLETHTVETEDGFLLTYFRIPYGKKSPPVPGKPPVILQHGILMSSSAWFFQDEDKTLRKLKITEVIM
jgi:gastric triacylglycerol lipase